MQDLFYAYDPAGNITHIQDDADTQNAVFFRNQRIEPSNDYTYDAIYRLIQASGREQLGLDGGGNKLPPTASSYNDVPRVGLSPAPTDGNAVGLYNEQYQYDAVGNFLQFIHKGPNPADPGWTRTYTYSETSLLEPGNVSNRLSQTAVSGNQPLIEPYLYDLHGNMITMPQLQAMQWNFKDELLMTQRQKVNDTDADGILHQGERTYYVYDAGGQRARKITESSGIRKKERFYLGGFEVYREYDAGGSITLERQTLHVMDDKQRVALVETRTQGNDSSPAQLMRYQFSNHLGSASLELDDAAQIISYEEYCPYGNTSYQSGRSGVEVALKRYRYTGMERDEESALSYHSARYYATWLGRWIAFDPIFISGGINVYAYAHARPIVKSDRNGMEDWYEVAGKVIVGTLSASSPVVLAPLLANDPVNKAAVQIVAGIAEESVDQAKEMVKTLLGDDDPGRYTTTLITPYESGKDYAPQFGGPLPELKELNPVYQLLVHGYETYRAAQRGDFREAGHQLTRTGEAALATIDIASSGATVATMAVGKLRAAAQAAPKAAGPIGEPVFLGKPPSRPLYRGVPGKTGLRSERAEQGIARPRGTKLDQESLIKHVKNEDVKAGVTSWTPIRKRAVGFAGGEGANGTVIEVDSANVADRKVPRPNVERHQHEEEVLLRGEIRGKPTKP